MDTNLLVTANEILNLGSNLLATGRAANNPDFDSRSGITNLLNAGQHILDLGQKIASTATNSFPEGSSSTPSCYSWMVVLCMLAGLILGSLALWAYQRAFKEQDSDKTEWLKIFGMGLGSVAMVPALLRTTSSSLLSDMRISVESRFIFVGFCVAATFAARRFLGTIPQKLIDSVAEANKKAENAKAQADAADSKSDEAKKIVNVVKDVVSHDPKQPVEEPKSFAATSDQSPVKAYNWSEVLVLWSLTLFPNGRTEIGVAADAGLSLETTWPLLQNLRDKKLLQQGLPRNLWMLTDKGKRETEALAPAFSTIPRTPRGVQ